MKYTRHILTSTALLTPLSVFAQVNDIFDAQNMVIGWLGQLGYLFFIASIMMFFWGLVRFIRNANDSDEHEAGKKLMIWGIIAFLVLVSLWAIVNIILVDTLGIDATDIKFIDKNGTVK